jgi:FMN phosphatase YigB (HAD superfamily)
VRLDLEGIEVVSWDVDGTLYDMADVRARVGRAIRRSMLSLRAPAAAWELMRLQHFRSEMQRVRRRGGDLRRSRHTVARPQRLRIEERWYLPSLRELGPRQGVVQALDQVAAAGVRQVVVSDYVSAHKLEALGLSGRFEALFSGEELGWLKPATELFRRVAEELAVAPERILHIGDREDTDGLSARGAGCRVLVLEDGPL